MLIERFKDGKKSVLQTVSNQETTTIKLLVNLKESI